MNDDEARGVDCIITIGFPSHGYAEAVHRSVEIDNDGYLETKVEGNDIVVRIRAGSLKSLLHTLDDFLACVGVADKVVSERD